MCNGIARQAAWIILSLAFPAGRQPRLLKQSRSTRFRPRFWGALRFRLLRKPVRRCRLRLRRRRELFVECRFACDAAGRGTCSITASQPGNGNFSAAPPVVRSFTVSLAKTSGSFTAATGSPFGTGQCTAIRSVGRLQRRWRSDLAIANSDGNNVTVLFGNGAGGFTTDPSGPFPAGTEPVSLVAGDFNGDGHADIAAANASSNDVTVLLGNGAGVFVAAGQSDCDWYFAFSLTVGDFNGDGIQDLVTTDANDSSLTVLLGDGTGKFTATSAELPLDRLPLTPQWGISTAMG